MKIIKNILNWFKKKENPEVEHRIVESDGKIIPMPEPIEYVPPVIGQKGTIMEVPAEVIKEITKPVKNKIMTTMTAQEKKDLIKKRLAEGDKRSYNEIAADLELQIWSEKHG